MTVIFHINYYLCKAFVSNLSANVKLSKAQMFEIIQSHEFLGRLLGLWIKVDLQLMKNVFQPLTKSVLIPTGLKAPASAVDAGINRGILKSG